MAVPHKVCCRLGLQKILAAEQLEVEARSDAIAHGCHGSLQDLELGSPDSSPGSSLSGSSVPCRVQFPRRRRHVSSSSGLEAPRKLAARAQVQRAQASGAREGSLGSL